LACGGDFGGRISTKLVENMHICYGYSWDKGPGWGKDAGGGGCEEEETDADAGEVESCVLFVFGLN
jgi:hypothetical protein